MHDILEVSFHRPRETCTDSKRNILIPKREKRLALGSNIDHTLSPRVQFQVHCLTIYIEKPREPTARKSQMENQFSARLYATCKYTVQNAGAYKRLYSAWTAQAHCGSAPPFAIRATLVETESLQSRCPRLPSPFFQIYNFDLFVCFIRQYSPPGLGVKFLRFEWTPVIRCGSYRRSILSWKHNSARTCAAVCAWTREFHELFFFKWNFRSPRRWPWIEVHRVERKLY